MDTTLADILIRFKVAHEQWYVVSVLDTSNDGESVKLAKREVDRVTKELLVHLGATHYRKD